MFIKDGLSSAHFHLTALSPKPEGYFCNLLIFKKLRFSGAPNVTFHNFFQNKKLELLGKVQRLTNQDTIHINLMRESLSKPRRYD